MQKSGLIVFALLLLAGFASAQVPSGNVFFGYSYYNTDLSSIDRANTNGWEASVEGKILPFIGFVADFDAHYGSQNFQGACIAGSARSTGCPAAFPQRNPTRATFPNRWTTRGCSWWAITSSIRP